MDVSGNDRHLVVQTGTATFMTDDITQQEYLLLDADVTARVTANGGLQ